MNIYVFTYTYTHVYIYLLMCLHILNIDVYRQIAPLLPKAITIYVLNHRRILAAFNNFMNMIGNVLLFSELKYLF